ncbi:hypothetical protein QUB52_12895 [Microcoleus sp. A6-C6]
MISNDRQTQLKYGDFQPARTGLNKKPASAGFNLSKIDSKFA